MYMRVILHTEFSFLFRQAGADYWGFSVVLLTVPFTVYLISSKKGTNNGNLER